MNTALKVVSGFIAGAAIGTIAGIIMHISDEIMGSLSNPLHSLTHTYRDKAAWEREFENGKLERSKAHA